MNAILLETVSTPEGIIRLLLVRMMVSSLVTEVPLQSVTSILTLTGPVWSPSNEMGISTMEVFSVTDNSVDAKPTGSVSAIHFLIIATSGK